MPEQPIRGREPQTEVLSGTTASGGPTRRQVVVGAGLGAGALALGGIPFLSGLFASLAQVDRPALGVVAPPSTRYPDLLGELAAGVRSGLAAQGQAEAPVLARAAANSAPSSAVKVARELIERDKVDLALVYANPTQAAFLGALAKESGVPVVVVDPGAHIVTSADADPRILSHSLGHWQSAWALGKWSVGAVGPKAYVISSLYESGFDTLHAFGHGLAHAGGTLAGASVTHVKPGDIGAAVRAAAASGADSLYVAASGHEADAILRAIAADKVASKMRLLVPGLSAGRLAAAPGLSAFTALTWPVAEKSAFRALGEDVGALVAAAVVQGREALPKGAGTHAGARGQVAFDLSTGRTDVAVSIHSATFAGGRLALAQQGAATNTSQATAYADDIVPKLRTGWSDVYGSST